LQNIKKRFTFLNILDNCNEDSDYYLPFLFDFRGRLYNTSSISPTFFTEIRYCIHFGKYDVSIPKKHQLSDKINNILSQYFNKIEEIKKYNNLQKEDYDHKIAII
jgi:hypothetical protein